MAKDNFKHGKNKMLSSYGGIGSIVETTDGSVIIETFDNWGYNNFLNSTNSEEIQKYLIIDDRLLSRLKYIFKNLRYIVSIPDENDKRIHPKANYFPKWFYCPRCKQFKEYYEWFNSWKEVGKDQAYFFPPKCSNKECNEEILEQVRFVMTCPNGHIQDLPWRYWNNRTKEKQPEQDFSETEEDESGGPIFLDFSSKCCSDQKLVYSVSGENSELSGIHIKCKSCGKSENLGGVFGFRMKCSGNTPWLGMNVHQNCEEKLKVVIKSSNSIYYANLISSIYIPVNQNPLSKDARIAISNLIENKQTKKQIVNIIKMIYKVPESSIVQYLNEGNENFISEIAYREVEYDYFLSKEIESNDSIKFSRIDVKNILRGFDTIVRIEKLKQISVQTSFTRQMPIDADAILLSDDEFDEIQYEVKRQSTTSKNINTSILPGIESFGEAILFTIEKAHLDEWLEKNNVLERASIIKKNAQFSQRKFIRRISENITPQFLLLHTLSHLIIKELEYVCGYPAASLKERLYVSDKMLGFMIMAIEGTEGSLGGLVSQCDDLENLNRIINSAIERAKDCSSDPICENSDGQGVENLNLAACYSCTLLSDISCEMFNSFLDRKLLIDNDFGFFKKEIS